MNSPALRAPKEHGSILTFPPLDHVSALLAENQRILEPLAADRTAARGEILAASTRYHLEGGEGGFPSPPAPLPEGEGGNTTPWLVAGHQPELFHPGVWYKNFVLHHLARRHAAASLNLIIDTDTAKPAMLHVPSDCRIVRVPYDRSEMETPYEERTVEDETLFADLPDRLAPILQRWDFEPMLATFWQEVKRQRKRTKLLGERFAAARRAMERRWGVVQRELPMSRVCQTHAFARFAGTILTQLPRFHEIHNRLVHAYRAAHDIRSKNHPVPDLTADGDWLEAPFWVWRKGQARRGRLFVRPIGDTFELRANASALPSIPSHPERIIDAWRDLESHGFKIRSRALTTTLFARLYLGDLFLHGIGGGIYDELTDQLISEFVGIPPPTFLVVSATLLLPLPRFPEAAAQISVLERTARDLVYKPELYLSTNLEAQSLQEAKQRWICGPVSTHVERVRRFHALREINAKLHPLVQRKVEDLQREMKYRRDQIDCHDVNSRRDYAFCFYPEEMLRTFFTT